MGMAILAIGVLALVSGILIMVVPQRILQMSQVIDKPVVKLDRQVSRYHAGVGICLILASFFLFYYGYYLGW